MMQWWRRRRAERARVERLLAEADQAARVQWIRGL